MNDNWEPEFLSNRDITNKQLTIKDFAFYLNYNENDPTSILFENLSKDLGYEDEDIDMNEKYKIFLEREANF
jgi:hypothetical protein